MALGAVTAWGVSSAGESRNGGGPVMALGVAKEGHCGKGRRRAAMEEGR